MDKPEKNKQFKFLFWVFIVISIVNIVYATLSYRGMYEDGGFYMLDQLNNLAAGNLKISFDPEHPRFFILAIMQLPVIFSYFVFGIKSKFALMAIFSFSQFAFPFLALLANYWLTKRTNRWDIFFWNVFTYGAVLCLYMIFSVTESLIGVTLNFILWNYLAADIDYKKRDIVAVILLVIIMFSTYEYVAYLGIMFFLAHFHYVVNENELKNQCVKTFIGLGTLAAAIYNIYYMLHVSGEREEIIRFLKEAHDFIPFLFNLNSLFSIAAVVLLLLFVFKKKQITNVSLGVFFVVNFIILIKLFLTTENSVYPMWEQHFRTIPCWFLPIVFLFMYCKDFVKGKSYNLNITNFICIALMCCVFQTIWQINNTYYWNKNIRYLKNELARCSDLLYLPANHTVISGFHNQYLRRYIWHGIYAATSILFSDSYEQKTLLVNYDVDQEGESGSYRSRLFVFPNNAGLMGVPFGAVIDIKNEFWDLTKVAEALDKYNKDNKIPTER